LAGGGGAPAAVAGVGSGWVGERADVLGGGLAALALRPDGERPGTRVRAPLPQVPAGALARGAAS
ncbi:MAG: hypothetical protein ACTIAP_03135, partial [Cellulosimicrobium funkei]